MSRETHRITEISDAFRALCLPLPSAQDMAKIRLGDVVPLEDYGCMLRIEQNLESPVDVPCSLWPIAGFSQSEYLGSSGYSVRLMPGIAQVGITARDHKALAGSFEAFGYKLCGEAHDDCGYLTCIMDARAEKVPVLFDITDIRDIFDDGFGVRRSCGEFREGEALAVRQKKVQEILYADLAVKCNSMIREQSPLKKSALARDFWRAMKAATLDVSHNGVPSLSASWKKAQGINAAKETQAVSIVSASQSYAQRIRADALHAAILSI